MNKPTVYGDIISGNCYKIKLLLCLLGRDHNWVHVDILKGEVQDRLITDINPNAKVPILVLPDGRSLSESNAILSFLGAASEFVPKDDFGRAKMLQWQFFEQYSHEPYVAVARFINLYLGLPAERKAEYDSKQAPGHKAFAVMEGQLALTPYLIGGQYTLADVSLYAYTHVAHEGGFDLSSYPGILAWLKRVAAHPKHVGMQEFL